MRKKVLCCALSAAMLLSLSGCFGRTEPTEPAGSESAAGVGSSVDDDHGDRSVEVTSDDQGMFETPDASDGQTEVSAVGDASTPGMTADGYETDGFGTDDVIDAIAVKLAKTDPDYSELSVTHSGGMADVHYSPNLDDMWMGVVDITRITDTSFWGTVEEKLEAAVNGMPDMHKVEPVSQDESHVTYIENTDTGWKYIDYAGCDGDLFIRINFSTNDECSDEDAMAYLQEFLGLLKI